MNMLYMLTKLTGVLYAIQEYLYNLKVKIKLFQWWSDINIHSVTDKYSSLQKVYTPLGQNLEDKYNSCQQFI